MLASLALFSFLSASAYAQSSTNSASTAIPTGISNGCSSFLQNLNQNSDVSSCASSIISATSPFIDSSSGETTDVSGALGSLCSSNPCSDSTLRSVLSNFYSSCNAELTSSRNVGVVSIYDMVYALSPMKSAVCAKDDSGSYCATKSTSETQQAAEEAQQYLSSGSVNTTAMGSSSLPFLFLSESFSDLCTACTRQILTPYIKFMSDLAYAPGIGSSTLLNKESSLYSAVTSNCGASFLSGTVQAAGGIGTGSTDGALTIAADVRILAAAILGMTSVMYIL